jgi:hypothetical protein
MGQILENNAEHVRRSADGLIAAYGGQAGAICQQQIDKMRRRNDAAGERLWRNVQELLRGASPS